MDNQSSGLLGFLGLVGCIAALVFLRRFAPFLSGILMTIVIIVAVLILLLVILVIFFAFQKTDNKGNLTDEQAAIFSKGRANLMELRRITMRIRSNEIRSLSNQICATAEKILKTLKEKPDSIPAQRQFFNYYLPTLGSILTKYLRVEKSDVPSQNMEENVVSYLKDIKNAMDKQYENLFENDILDLSVEMEAMTIACKRDGLLSDDSTQIQDGERKIDLTL